MKGISSFVVLLSCCIGVSAAAEKPVQAHHGKSAAHRKIDRSGNARKGKASYYGPGFSGKRMADGTRMDPDANIAASKTLPLGTKAKVENLENGKSAVVEIRDRGPYVDGRIVDVSPKVAGKLGMKEKGVAPVVVTPLKIPPANASKR